MSFLRLVKNNKSLHVLRGSDIRRSVEARWNPTWAGHLAGELNTNLWPRQHINSHYCTVATIQHRKLLVIDSLL
jgi:hypothetical protein